MIYDCLLLIILIYDIYLILKTAYSLYTNGVGLIKNSGWNTLRTQACDHF